MTRAAYSYQDLGEDGFAERMKSEVEPYLASLCQKQMIESTDATRICCRLYHVSDAKASILLVHGFCEFAEKHTELIYHLVTAGYSVCVPEMRGHGDSTRFVDDLSKVHIKDFQDYISDVRSVYLTVFTDEPSPKYLMGHSMGGAIAAMYLTQYPDDFDRCVLCSPMIRMITPPGASHAETEAYIADTCLKGMGEEYVMGEGPFDGVPHFGSSSCTSEARFYYIFNKRVEHPRYQTWSSSNDWLNAAFKAEHYLEEDSNRKRVKTPTLIFGAERDALVDIRSVEEFSKSLANSTYVFVPNSKHEIFNALEPERRFFYSKVFGFLGGDM